MAAAGTVAGDKGQEKDSSLQELLPPGLGLSVEGHLGSRVLLHLQSAMVMVAGSSNSVLDA